MLQDGLKLKLIGRKVVWRDVGTIQSLHEANMDVALNRENFNLYDDYIQNLHQRYI